MLSIFVLLPTKKVVSSAYCVILTSSFVPGRAKPLILGFFRITCPRTSARRTYKIAERGHPCLNPLEVENISAMCPFMYSADLGSR